MMNKLRCPYCKKMITLIDTKITILKFLNKNRGMSNYKNIENFTEKTHSCIFEHIEYLIKNGFVKKEKIKLPNEKKEFKIIITDKGKKFIKNKKGVSKKC